MFGRLTHEQRLRRFVADVLVGAGMYEAYTYSLQHGDPGSKRARAARAALVAAARAANDACRRAARRGEAQPRHGKRRRRALRDRARVPAARPGARGALAARRDRAGRLLRARRASSRRCSPHCTSSRCSRHAELAHELVVAATVQSGWVGTYAPGVALDGEWSAFELDLAELFALVPERIEYRDVITYPPAPPGPRVRRRRGHPGRRPDRRRTRSGRRGAARRAVPLRLPRRPDPRRQEVGRVLGRVPVGRANAHGRRRGALRGAVVAVLAHASERSSAPRATPSRASA